MNGEGGGEAPPPDAPTYSRAFENMVRDADDTVGLLAYALYKETVREEVRQGMDPGARKRNPTSSTVAIYRQAAEQRVAEIVSGGIQQATPDIQKSAMLEAINNSVTTVNAHVTARTGFWGAFLTNMVAWLATLLIAIAILTLANRPSIEDKVVDTANKIIGDQPQNGQDQ